MRLFGKGNGSGRRGLVIAAAIALAVTGVTLIVITANSQLTVDSPPPSAAGSLSAVGRAGPPPTVGTPTRTVTGAPDAELPAAPNRGTPPGGTSTPAPQSATSPSALVTDRRLASPRPRRTGTSPTADTLLPNIPMSLPSVADPAAITIPAISVHTDLIRLGTNPDGTLQVPTTTNVAGWYTGSVPPGQIGPAVIAGHVDSYRGPGVFFRLGDLRPGDTIRIRRADQSTATFTVTGVRQYSKDDFPTTAVYGIVDVPALRLITCGGTFDHDTGNYLSNIVVYAELSGITQQK